MRNPKILLLIIFACFHLAFADETATVAVLNFENHSIFDKESYASLSSGLAEMMSTPLSQIQSIQLVERRNLQKVIDEIKMAQAGVLSDDKAQQVGKLAGAQYLVFGSFMVAPGDKIRIDMRIVNAETGLTEKAEEVTGKTKNILSLVNTLGKKMVNQLSLSLTGSENAAFAKSQDLNFKAVLAFSNGVQAEDQGDFATAKNQYRKALEIEPKFEQAKSRLTALQKAAMQE